MAYLVDVVFFCTDGNWERPKRFALMLLYENLFCLALSTTFGITTTDETIYNVK